MKRVCYFLFGFFAMSIIACNADSADQNNYEKNYSDQEVNEIIGQLRDSVELDGVEFLSKEEYDKIPTIDSELLDDLRPEGELNMRSSYLKINTPPVWNQGTEGSCVAFSSGYVALSYYLNRIKKLPYTINGAYRSPEFIYNNIKLGNSCSSGSYIHLALNLFKNHGACNWDDMPYSYSNGCSNKGNTTHWNKAKSGKIKSYYRLTSFSSNTIKSYLKRYHPIIVAMTLDNNFYGQTDKYPYIYKTTGGSDRGGHAFVITGYDDNKRAFIAQNSWGASKHDKGYFYLSYDVISKLNRLEMYVIDPV